MSVQAPTKPSGRRGRGVRSLGLQHRGHQRQLPTQRHALLKGGWVGGRRKSLSVFFRSLSFGSLKAFRETAR